MGIGKVGGAARIRGVEDNVRFIEKLGAGYTQIVLGPTVGMWGRCRDCRQASSGLVDIFGLPFIVQRLALSSLGPYSF